MSIRDKEGEGLWLAHLGYSFKSKKEYIKAIDYLKHSHEIIKKNGDKLSESISSFNLGEIYDILEDNNKAIENYKCALVSFKLMLGEEHRYTKACINKLQIVISKIT